MSHACWRSAAAAGGRPAVDAPFLHLARAFAAIEPVFGRIRIACMLVNTFRSLLLMAPEAVLPSVMLTIGQLGSAHDALVLSVGGATVSDAIIAAFGGSKARVSSLYKTSGDLGDVAAEMWKTRPAGIVKEKPLVIRDLWSRILALCAVKGAGAAARRKGDITALLRRCVSGEEVRYLVRFLIQNMRIHVTAVTAVTALAQAVAYQEETGERTAAASAVSCSVAASASGADAFAPSSSSSSSGGGKRDCGGSDASDVSRIPSAVKTAMDRAARAARRCLSECPDITRLCSSLVGGGVARMLAECRASVGIPLKPMLARITSGVDEAFERFCGVLSSDATSAVSSDAAASASSVDAGKHLTTAVVPVPRAFTAEWKYDGQRAQIHYDAAGFTSSPGTAATAATAGSASSAGAGSPSRSSAVAAAAASSLMPSPPTDRRVRVFSRHMDNTTARWPDCVAAVRAAIDADAAETAGQAAATRASSASAGAGAASETSRSGGLPAVTSFVIDAEIVAVRRHTGSKSAASTTPSPRPHGASDSAAAVIAVAAAGIAEAGSEVTAASGRTNDAAIVYSSLLAADGSELDAHAGFEILPFQVLSTRSRPAAVTQAPGPAAAAAGSLFSTSAVGGAGAGAGASASRSTELARRSSSEVAVGGPSDSGASPAVAEYADDDGPDAGIQPAALQSTLVASAATAEAARGADISSSAGAAAAPSSSSLDGIAVCVLAFDLMALNGQPLLHMSLRERRALLRQHFRIVPGAFSFARGIDIDLRPSAVAAFAGSGSDGLAAGSSGSSSAAAVVAPASSSGSAALGAAGLGAQMPEQTVGPGAAAWEAALSLARERLSEELHAAFRGCCEGVMIKLLDNQPGDARDDAGASSAGKRGGYSSGAAADAEAGASGKRSRIEVASADAITIDSDGDDDASDDSSGSDSDDDDHEKLSAAASNRKSRAQGSAASGSASLAAAGRAGVARSSGGKASAASSAKGKKVGAAASTKGKVVAAAAGAAQAASSASLVATYQPDVRSNAWLKLKRDYVEGLADSIDAVPIAAWHGNGRKAGWLSPFLLAVYDRRSGRWQSLCRVMSGFSDAFYREASEFYCRPENQLAPAEARRIYETGEEPPIWLRPCEVWEIRGADLTLSPVHASAAGLVHSSRGISMRFPRFLRKRSPEEKTPADASSPAFIAELYRAQARKLDGNVQSHSGGGGGAGAGAGGASASNGDDDDDGEAGLPLITGMSDDEGDD